MSTRSRFNQIVLELTKTAKVISEEDLCKVAAVHYEDEDSDESGIIGFVLGSTEFIQRIRDCADLDSQLAGCVIKIVKPKLEIVKDDETIH